MAEYHLTHKDLERINDKLDRTISELTLLRIEVAGLKIKSGVWGFAAGAIPSVLFLITQLLLHKK